MEKSILNRFLKYVSLNILGMVSISCYILADTFFISKSLGARGLAALNLSIPIYSIVYGVGLMLGIGGSTRYSILKTKNEDLEANRVYSICVKTALLIGIVFAVIGLFFSSSLAIVFGADNNTLPMTETYLKTILCFSPFIIMNNVLISFVRNDNNPKLTMVAMLTGSFSNIFLDYIFMFPLGMGMFGAAFATCLAPIISMGVLAIHFIRKDNNFKYIRYTIKLSYLRDITSLGLSALVNEISSAVVLITFNLVILRLEGNLGLASYGIVANIALVAIAIFTGLAQGIQPIISEGHGLNNDLIVKKTLKYALFTSISLAILIYFGVVYNAESIISIFNKDGNIEIAQIGKSGLIIYFIGFFFAGINIVMTMFLTATEQAKNAFTISILRGFIIIVPMVLLLSSIWKMTGVWLSFTFTEIIVTITTIYITVLNSKAILYLKFESNS